MKVYLTSAYPHCAATNFGPQWVSAHAAVEDRALLAESADEADCILFVENHPGRDPYFFEVLRSALYKRHRRKCVLYHDADLSVTALPTLSPSIERWQLGKGSKRAAHYVARLCENDAVNAAPLDWSSQRRYLYSFVGSSRTHSVRRRLLAQRHSGAIAIDTKDLRAWQMTAAEKNAYELEYLSIAIDSFFILCPRGIGPSTYRLFEAMQLGRVPVIIADQWVGIEDIDWTSCTIRIAENDLERIPKILEQYRDDAIAMGRAARTVWENHFSPSASLRTLARGAAALSARGYGSLDSCIDRCQFLAPYHLRGLARHLRRSARGRFTDELRRT